MRNAFLILAYCGSLLAPAGKFAWSLDPEVTPPTRTSWASFRNGIEQRGIAGSELPEQLELLWEVPTEFGVSGTAAIVGRHVYVPVIDGELLCLDRTDGRKIWSYRSIGSIDPKDFAPGFKSAPLVVDRMVLLGDEDGVFHGIDRQTGKQLWTFATGAEIAGGASAINDKVVFGSHDSFLYCLTISDGKLVWKFQTEDRVNCAPAISDGHTFISGCDEHLRVIDLAEGKQVADIPLNSFLIASPAVVGNSLYVGTYASEVVGLDWKEQKFLWRFKDQKREFPYHASAAVTDKYVLLGGHDRLFHCIDRLTGTEVWNFPTRAVIDSSPAVSGKRVFFGSKDTNLYAVEIDSGKEAWKVNLGRDITAGPAIGENVLVIGSEGSRGKIFCFGSRADSTR